MEDTWRTKARSLIEPIVSNYIVRWDETQYLLILHLVPDKEDPGFDENHPVIEKIAATGVCFYSEIGCSGRLKVNIYLA